MNDNDKGLDMGRMALEGLGQMMDSMAFVKRAWSTFDLPTPFAPTSPAQRPGGSLNETCSNSTSPPGCA